MLRFRNPVFFNKKKSLRHVIIDDATRKIFVHRLDLNSYEFKTGAKRNRMLLYCMHFKIIMLFVFTLYIQKKLLLKELVASGR